MTTQSNIANTSLEMERQLKSEWCWAAVSVSVNRVFRPESTHTQCEIVTSALDLPCCGSGNGAHRRQCNVPHELHTVLGRLHLLAADPKLKPLSFSRIRGQINGGRPVCVLIRWLDEGGNPGRGHFIAISGYKVTRSGREFVAIADPLFGPSHVAFDTFSDPRGGYRDGQGLWFASFLVDNMAQR